RRQAESFAATTNCCEPVPCSQQENFTIGGKHSLLGESRDDSAPVLAATPLPHRIIPQQAFDCSGNRRLIVARNDEILVFLAHHPLDISYIDRDHGTARRHCLEQRIRHLLCIG